MSSAINKHIEIPVLYTLKFVCALGVVYQHVKFDNECVFLLSKLAVPAFFCISGYFLYNPFVGKVENSRIIKAIYKTSKILIWSNVFYLLANILFGGAIVDHFKWQSVVGVVVYGSTFCGPLWYLNAYIEILLLILLMLKCSQEDKLVWLALLGYAISLMLGRYAFVFNFDCPFHEMFSRNFLTHGAPYVLMGVYIRKYWTKIKVMSSLPLLTFFVLLFAIESYFYCLRFPYGGNGDIGIATPLMVFSIYVFLLKYCNNIKIPYILCTIGKRYTLYIYVLHIFFLNLIVTQTNIDNRNVLFLLCFGLPILFAWSVRIVFNIICK